MRRFPPILAAILLGVSVLAPAAIAGDRPFSTSDLIASRLAPIPKDPGATNIVGGGGSFSKVQIERFRCDSSGNPASAVDMSCNTTEYGQDWAPDNELAIAVDPADPDHLLAGSNDYYYRFNNSTGARQALVPTGFFTSFDGGATWIDGQVPMRTGNGAGDPAPAFDGKHDTALMAQLENTAGLGGAWVAQGDVTVSRSTDGGVTWREPVIVMQGQGAGIGPANNAVFWDKEYITVDNNPGSPFYGRTYVTATRFANGLHGSYTDSPIFLSYSDDGGRTWTAPAEISGSNPAVCTYQETGPAGQCDEDQFSNPEVAPDGTLYVYFLNEQNQAQWEHPYDFDQQVMIVRSTDGGATFSSPVPVVQLEDGFSDMPFSVIGSQTIWGHQIRWSSFGNLAISPADPNDLAVVWADRGTANPNATDGCAFGPHEAPNYDPCGAGPGAVISVYMSRSYDGGATWSSRTPVAATGTAQWFPWAAFKPDGTLAVAFDQDTTPAPADTFQHVLWVDGAGSQALGSLEHPDVSVTHWAGQYTTAFPAICGPAGSSDPGKDCNVFDGDYTGMAIGSDGSINVVWTGLNRFVTSPQTDFYTGEPHQGYAQDAMFARR
jgi:hypothetical protein